jgi:hypothetical protein
VLWTWPWGEATHSRACLGSLVELLILLLEGENRRSYARVALMDSAALSYMLLRRALFPNMQASAALGRICVRGRACGGERSVASSALDTTGRGHNRTTTSQSGVSTYRPRRLCDRMRRGRRASRPGATAAIYTL